MASERLGNLGVNAALVVISIIVVVLTLSLVRRWMRADAGPDLSRSDDHVQVDVRNGCGEPGLAARMSLYLRDHGFDVVEAGNHTRLGELNSFIADRVGTREASERLARIVGLGADRIREDIRNDYLLDATLVIGCDFALLRPFSEDE